MPLNRKHVNAIIFIVLLLAVALSFIIKVPYTIYTRGVVYPVKEWTLNKTTDGNLIQILRNNRDNTISEYAVTEFFRGDASEFRMNRDIFNKKNICKGDTIGLIYSNEDYFRLLEIEGKLEAEKKLLDIYTSGEKPEIVQYYKELSALALEDWNSQKKIFERVEKLFKDSLIARNDYDIAYNDLKLKEHAYKVAESNVQSAASGAKEQQINMSRSMIESYEFQRNQLNEKIKTNTIKAPFDGIIVKQKKANRDLNGNIIDVEEILKIVDISSLLVVLPVEFFESQYFKEGGTVDFGTNDNSAALVGEIIEIDNTVQILKRRQVVFITAEIKENTEGVYFNMFLDGEVECGNIKLSEYFLRLFNMVTEN